MFDVLSVQVTVIGIFSGSVIIWAIWRLHIFVMSDLVVLAYILVDLKHLVYNNT